MVKFIAIRRRHGELSLFKQTDCCRIGKGRRGADIGRRINSQTTWEAVTRKGQYGTCCRVGEVECRNTDTLIILTHIKRSRVLWSLVPLVLPWRLCGILVLLSSRSGDLHVNSSGAGRERGGKEGLTAGLLKLWRVRLENIHTYGLAYTQKWMHIYQIYWYINSYIPGR